MSVKVEEASRNIQSTTTAPTTSAAKISIFANKSGFVIPKNKLSGSLVPVLRGGKKDGSESVNEEITKQVQRKTKWGPDLTQDTTVRKGKALAYQTRVDQITQQLNSGPMDWEENQDTLTASSIQDFKLNNEKIKLLELEKREAIGEILKLNPNYKPPAGYKPIQKEAKVPIPIKEHPGYNFIGLIFGPVSDTHKRLEKETGAKVKVYGIKADTGQKVEVTSADGNETSSTYQEMYVQVLADTYEKVDAAVSLIELLFTPVSVKAGSASMTTSSNNGMDAADNPGVVQPTVGSGLAPAHGHFQQYPWFSGSASQNTILTLPGSMSSMDPSATVVCNPAQVSSSPNPSSTPSLFVPPGMVAGFGSVSQNPSLVSSRPNMPPVLQQQYMPLAPLGQIGAPRNPLTTASGSTVHQNMIVPPQVSVNQPVSAGTSQVFRPAISNQSLPSVGAHTGWSGWNSTVAQGTNMMPMTSPIAAPQGSHPVVSNPMAISVAPPVGFPRGNLSGSASAGIAVNQQPTNSVLQSQMRPPLPQHPPSAHPNSSLPPHQASNLGAPRPQHPGSSDFIFQPHRPPNPASQAIPRPVSHFDPPSISLQNQLIQPGHAPQMPPIRPEMRNLNPSHVMQVFPELQVNNRMIHRQPTPVNFAGGPAGPPPPIRPMAFPNSSGPSPIPFAQMHPRNFNPGPPPNSNSYPPRAGNLMFQRNNPAMMTHPPNFPTPNNEFRPSKPPSGAFGAQQTYDPFSPTSLS